MARRWCLVLAALLMAATLASCRWESEDMQRVVDGYEALVSAVGSFQITNDRELIGSRMRGTDAYTGSYTADCQDADGRDVIFGGRFHPDPPASPHRAGEDGSGNGPS